MADEQIASDEQPDADDEQAIRQLLDEAYQGAVDDEGEKRLWLKAIVPILQLRQHDQDRSGRVQFAFDMLAVAACERARRILGSDLPPTESP